MNGVDLPSNSTRVEYKISDKSFEFLSEGKITKESIEIIFSNMMCGKTKSVEESIQKESLSNVDDNELAKIIESIIEENLNIIKLQGAHSIGALMGIAMKTVRGKASGEKVNQVLMKKIQEYLNKNKE